MLVKVVSYSRQVTLVLLLMIMFTTQLLFTKWHRTGPSIAMSRDQLADHSFLSSFLEIETEMPQHDISRTGQLQNQSISTAVNRSGITTDGKSDPDLVWLVPGESPVNCTLLRIRNMTERSRARALLERETALGLYRITPDEEFTTMGCPSIRKDFYTQQVSSEESDFPLAFGIRMHQNVAQFHRLISSIYRPHNLYCIYIDQKAPSSVHDGVRAIINCFANMFIASHLHDYLYGSYSAVRADLQCMRDTIKENISWKYFLNMAGTEFPLRTNAELVAIIKRLNGSNDIEQQPFPEIFNDRIQWKYVERNAQLKQTKQPWPPFSYQGRNITLKKGCAYGIFKREFIQWVLESNLAANLLEWSKKINSPDEVVWATLNSLPEAPGGYPVRVSQVFRQFVSREIMWQWTGVCHGEIIHSICVFGLEDIYYLSKTPAVIANKFNLTLDHLIMDCLDQQLRHRTLNSDPHLTVNWTVIDAMPHVRYARPSSDRYSEDDS